MWMTNWLNGCLKRDVKRYGEDSEQAQVWRARIRDHEAGRKVDLVSHGVAAAKKRAKARKAKEVL